MKNSSKYRVPPLRRTRDSFIDDANSSENPRIDLGESRHTQVRRDKDTVRSISVTLYDVDFAIKTFIESTIMPKIRDGYEVVDVPVLYANAEKWASIQSRGYLRDAKGKSIAPLITFRRSSVAIKQELRKNKVSSVNQMAYVTAQKYSRTQPYDRNSALFSTSKQREYFLTPIPDYVDIIYDFIVWTEYQSQLNELIEQFIWFGGQSFGDKNWFKFPSYLDNVSIEDTNMTGQDRLVRATFQLTIHAYLLPKEASGEVTTKRVVTPNKIQFVSEAFGDIGSSIVDRYRPFKPLNVDAEQDLKDYQRELNDFNDTSLPASPDVYTSETD